MARLRRRGLEAPIRAWIAAGRPLLGHLPRPAAALRRERRGRRRHARRAARTDRAPRRRAAPAAHRLEPGGAPARPPAVRRGSTRVPTSTSSTRTPRLPPPERRRAGRSPRRPTAARFVSAVARGALAGVQFHPERSGRDGLRLLANFVGLAGAAARPRQTPVSRRPVAGPQGGRLMLRVRVIPCLDVAQGPGRQGHPVRRPHRRGRPAGARGTLRGRGRRRDRLPRHRRRARRPRHAPRRRAAHGPAGLRAR